MKFQKEYFYCSPRLLANIDEIKEIENSIYNVRWEGCFQLNIDGRTLEHQTAYNKAFEIEFSKHYGRRNL
jgi:hypothetical protein